MQQQTDQDETIDDIVDFLCGAIPDVLFERALDVCATHTLHTGVEDVLYALIDEELVYDNPFWETSGYGFGKNEQAT